MTCVIAIESGGKVLLGSDSFIGDTYTSDVIDSPKFFKVREGFAIGFAGGVRPGQILKHLCKFPKVRKGQSDESYLVELASGIRELFDSQGALMRAAAHQQVNDSVFLVAFKGKVYILQEDFSIIRVKSGYTAIGSGDIPAMAVIHALGVDGDREQVEDTARRAMEASEKYCTQVLGPFHFEWV